MKTNLMYVVTDEYDMVIAQDKYDIKYLIETDRFPDLSEADTEEDRVKMATDYLKIIKNTSFWEDGCEDEIEKGNVIAEIEKDIEIACVGDVYEDPEGKWEITAIKDGNAEIVLTEDNKVDKAGILRVVPLEEAEYFLTHSYLE
jgi:hypothetical protein